MVLTRCSASESDSRPDDEPKQDTKLNGDILHPESILLEVGRHAIPKARMVSVNEGAENRG